MTRIGLALWPVAIAAVVLATRVVVYALAPSQGILAARLERRAGGPDLAGALATIVVVAAAVGAAVLWLTVVAVRERVALERRRLPAPPRLRPVRAAAHAAALFVASSLAFALLESYLHWRAGLGWHGLRCLLGPVHRDAFPVLAALSLVAAALHAALEHVLAWARRAVLLLAAQLPVLRNGAVVAVPAFAPRGRLAVHLARPRGPPRRFVSVSVD